MRLVGHCQQALGLVRAHDQRYLLRLLDVIDLGGEIVPPQRDAEQEPQARHRAVACADAQPALGQVQLEPADVVGGRRVGRALQEGREPLAAVDVRVSERMCKEVSVSLPLRGDSHDDHFDDYPRIA